MDRLLQCQAAIICVFAADRTIAAGVWEPALYRCRQVSWECSLLSLESGSWWLLRTFHLFCSEAALCDFQLPLLCR